MVKVVLDTNVILDAVESARPEHDAAILVIDRLLVEDAQISVVATSLEDIYYILSRRSSPALARRIIEELVDVFAVLPVDAECCRLALESTEADVEDGLIRAAAEIAAVDYLVTRDRQAFVGSLVPSISPVGLLSELEHRSH
ncbi:MAG: PIN domain-containing protein [Propionibacteriaceae bacterium]|jgi:predicted nucleic acid-binding protein|nr:PIN domain-containing protein [Propionibacteriaceae bacterium]